MFIAPVVYIGLSGFPATFLPAFLLGVFRSTKLSFLGDVGTETPEAMNVVMHIGNETAHATDQHLCSCTVAQL